MFLAAEAEQGIAGLCPSCKRHGGDPEPRDPCPRPYSAVLTKHHRLRGLNSRKFWRLEVQH